MSPSAIDALNAIELASPLRALLEQLITNQQHTDAKLEQVLEQQQLSFNEMNRLHEEVEFLHTQLEQERASNAVLAQQLANVTEDVSVLRVDVDDIFIITRDLQMGEEDIESRVADFEISLHKLFRTGNHNERAVAVGDRALEDVMLLRKEFVKLQESVSPKVVKEKALTKPPTRMPQPVFTPLDRPRVFYAPGTKPAVHRSITTPSKVNVESASLPLFITNDEDSQDACCRGTKRARARSSPLMIASRELSAEEESNTIVPVLSAVARDTKRARVSMLVESGLLNEGQTPSEL